MFLAAAVVSRALAALQVYQYCAHPMLHANAFAQLTRPIINSSKKRVCVAIWVAIGGFYWIARAAIRRQHHPRTDALIVSISMPNRGSSRGREKESEMHRMTSFLLFRAGEE